MVLPFQIIKRDRGSHARSARLVTSHGPVDTPVFMPVGTQATVKAAPHELLEQLDAQIILVNSYHLYLRPGEELIRKLGGVHRFMSWKRPVLSDSGGYQVFSQKALTQVLEDGVRFRSHLDGSWHFLSPEKSVQIQAGLGSDIIMAFDECTNYPVSKQQARESMLRSMQWARRSKSAHHNPEQALFGIVQGGVFADLRKQSLEQICELDFQGLALGGLSVGEPKALMCQIVEELGPQMPEEKPRYVMGVGTPLDLVHCVKQGIDLFDCVLPTRGGRNGLLYTSEGKVNIKNARYRYDEQPVDPNCSCLVCRRYSRSYLRHLYVSGEILSAILNTLHNLHFYLRLMAEIRKCIGGKGLSELEKTLLSGYSKSSCRD